MEALKGNSNIQIVQILSVQFIYNNIHICQSGPMWWLEITISRAAVLVWLKKLGKGQKTGKVALRVFVWKSESERKRDLQGRMTDSVSSICGDDLQQSPSTVWGV